MEEIWRDIDNYEGLYQVSSLGRVKSLGRFESGHYRNGDKNASYYRKEKILKPKTNKHGYYTVRLYKNGNGSYYLVHRLVANAFIPNPMNLPEIDHISTIRTENNVENLRWVDRNGNGNNPTTKKNMIEAQTISCGRKVVCIKDGKIVKTFDSISSAARYYDMKTHNSIWNCLKGKAKSAYGFKWRYADS